MFGSLWKGWRARARQELRRVLAEAGPYEASPTGRTSAAQYDVMQWDQWAFRQEHWRCLRYPGTPGMTPPAVDRLVEEHWVEDFECDMQDVDGLGASKSDLSACASLDEFAERNAQHLIVEVSEESLRKTLAHKEIRIIHGSGDFFLKHSWDERLFLCNAGGSHHFAAARFIAARLGKRVRLRGRLCSRALLADAVGDLVRNFGVFALPWSFVHELVLPRDEGAEFDPEHERALAGMRASYYMTRLRLPGQTDAAAIWLPNDNPQSVAIAAELDAAGGANIGSYLAATITQA